MVVIAFSGGRDTWYGRLDFIHLLEFASSLECPLRVIACRFQ
jgi:hypothetical protein